MEEPAAKKPGFNVRKALTIFGSICAAVVLVAIVVGLITGPAANRNLKTSRAFAERAIMAVTSEWNADSLWALASDEFVKATPKAQTYDLMARLGARLGPVRSLGEPHWYIMQSTGGATVTYQFPATFANAPGTVSLRVVQRGREWKVQNFGVTSDSLHVQ